LDYLTTHASLSPIQRGFEPGFVNYNKGWTRLTAASDKAYQLLAHGRWFSPGTPPSSTTKTGPHDIGEILLKMALKHQKYKNKIKHDGTLFWVDTDTKIKRSSLKLVLWAKNLIIIMAITYRKRRFLFPDIRPAGICVNVFPKSCLKIKE